MHRIASVQKFSEITCICIHIYIYTYVIYIYIYIEIHMSSYLLLYRHIYI